jgi:D-sedoheptulose 7-phosphate isomerase
VEAGLNEFIGRELLKTAEVMHQLRSSPEFIVAVETITTRCIEAYRTQNKVLLAGNGGSAADAQHIAGELVSRFAFDRPALPAVALTVDTSVLTAIGNDYGYEMIFERQVAALGRAGDVFIAISTSGRSPNILRALAEARRNKLFCIGFTGRRGGDMPGLCDVCLRIPSDETPKVQEGHIVTAHIICGLIDKALFAGRAPERANLAGGFGSVRNGRSPPGAASN